MVLSIAALISCQDPSSISISASTPTPDAETLILETSNSIESTHPSSETASLWESDLSTPNWLTQWQPRQEKSWGLNNVEIVSMTTPPFEHILRVHYPAGSASPSVARNTDSPLGGAQFYGDLFIPAQDKMQLTYYVRFANGFDFVKGGKLPGLFGGTGASGGSIPNGTDGFSARLMWRQNGQGEVYAYMPTSENYGTSIGRGTWTFQPNTWYKVTQEIQLNTPNINDGQIRLWINDSLVLEKGDLLFRTVNSLQVDGIFFSTFFGGSDSSWATPQDTYIDFANFSVSVVN
ncbi:polysaccharide lyase [Leptolyngbya sp. Heron Island J]|nr:polysaccharide lyase [Leptolyngbya sp. Heron Island J]